ncbi:14290_t:CDS:2 [Ambispora leptoticha]|uniref:14290_t:CDS:1 n=1 Tax=Ambispora leptoticha TaxID=144679 RepID=A0A9N8ZKT8_9GLOM|nr:14290_t:CDS:2 [Ambispora leptoticha]
MLGKMFDPANDAKQEIEIFQIPILTSEIDLAVQQGAALLHSVEIKFYECGSYSIQKPDVSSWRQDFSDTGYGILRNFAAEIEKRILIRFLSLNWEIKEGEITLKLFNFVDSVKGHLN